MSYAAEAQAIRSRFHTQWNDTTRVAWPNAKFDPTPGQPWVRLSILTADAETVSLPAPTTRYRHGGMVSVQVFVPDNEGDERAKDLAELACGIFRGVSADGVNYQAPYVTEGGNDGNGWYMLNVWVPYYRDSLF